MQSGSTHTRSQGVFPEVIIREGLLWQSSSCLVSDNHILYKSCPAHVWVSKRFGHQPLVWFYGFVKMTHVPTGPNNQFSEVASMGHHKHVRLQANQEVKSCQTCHMLPETI